MSPPFSLALKTTWLVFILYWVWSARNVKRTVRAEPFVERFVLHWVPLGMAVYLLGPGERFGHSLLREQFVPHSTLVESLGLAPCIAGVVLACYARSILGRNWSAVVQIKDDHELIERGPYRLVRHPIYTGILLLFLGNAVMVGDWRGLLAVAIVFVTFWRKLRKEERWLSQHFGQPYLEYMQRTRALVPGVL